MVYTYKACKRDSHSASNQNTLFISKVDTVTKREAQ